MADDDDDTVPARTNEELLRIAKGAPMTDTTDTELERLPILLPTVAIKPDGPPDHHMTEEDWVAFKEVFDWLVGVRYYGKEFLKGIVDERGTFACPICGSTWPHYHDSRGMACPLKLSQPESPDDR